MSAKASYTGASLLSLLFAGAALCQPASPGGAATPTTALPPLAGQTTGSGYGAPAPAVGGVEGIPGMEAATPIPDPWITYPQPHCCGPVGGDGPIQMEIYWRAGPVFPVGGHALTRAIGVGWEVQGGGRSLFFNVPRDRAFVIDLSVANAFNAGDNTGIIFNVQGNAATIRSVNRTFVALGLGEEHWLRQPASTCCDNDWNWRWGYDAGFRYGTVRVDTNFPTSLPFFPSGYARLNNRLYGTYLAAHTDVELPRGCCTYMLGARAEWQYDWIGTFGSRSDISAINLLVTGGVRF